LYWIIKNNFEVDHAFQLLCKGIKPINNVNTVYININKSNKICYFFICIRAKFDSVTYIRRRDVIEPGRSVTNSIAEIIRVQISLNAESKLRKGETTLTVEREVTPTQNHHYHWRLSSPIFSRKWTSFIMLNWCIYLLKPFKRKTCLQYLTLHKMSFSIVSWV